MFFGLFLYFISTRSKNQARTVPGSFFFRTSTGFATLFPAGTLKWTQINKNGGSYMKKPNIRRELIYLPANIIRPNPNNKGDV